MDFTFISLSVIHAYDFFISTVIYFSYVWYLAGSVQEKAPSWESSSLSKSSEIAVEGRNKTLYCLALGRWFVVIDSFLKKIFKLFQSNGSDINCCQLFFVICSLTCRYVECFFFCDRFANHFLYLRVKGLFNPLTPTSDQDRISPYKINQISDENEENYQFWDN